MKQVAIIGAGIVGATTAYYLSKDDTVEVTVFDEGIGQATKASAGIISPWFSKRRHKAWYRLARMGADFYQKLTQDLEADGVTVDFYRQTGTYLFKKDETKLEELYDIAMARREESPLIGELAFMTQAEAREKNPDLTGFDRLIYAQGGAKISGADMTQTLLDAANCQVIAKKVTLEAAGDQWLVDGKTFDQVVVAAGAWLPQVLAPLGYDVQVKPQKGQILDLKTPVQTEDLSVLFPEGEIDIIPLNQGVVSVGASHENGLDFDLSVDDAIIDRMLADAAIYWPSLQDAEKWRVRVGIRATNNESCPFFGPVANQKGLYVASGLGSTGLTTGPLIAYELASLISSGPSLIDWQDYSPEKYLKAFPSENEKA